ncbi:MAG: Mu transposase C-terminal domain-containing protein [bacterium]
MLSYLIFMHAYRKHTNIDPAHLNEEGWKKVRIVAEAVSCPKGFGGKDGWYEEIASRYNISKQTIYRYLNLYRQKRLFQPPKKPGLQLPALGTGLYKWDEEAAQFAIGLILHNKWDQITAKELYAQIQVEASQHNPAWQIGSEKSFYRLIKKVAEPVYTLRDRGRRGLLEEMPPIYRDCSCYHPWEVLCGDQHKCDILCVDDNNEILFLELFMWRDMRTRLQFISLTYKHYNKYTVGLALREAYRFGIPSGIYTDWGKSENSKYIQQLRARLSGGVQAGGWEEFFGHADLKEIVGQADQMGRAGSISGSGTGGVNHQKAQPYRARSKPIEGDFSHLDQELKNRQMAGYFKRRTNHKENKELQDEVKKQYAGKKLLHYTEVINEVMEIVDRWNHHKFVNATPSTDNGKSPWQIYQEEIEESPVVFLNDITLDWLFLPERRITPQKGLITFQTDFFGPRRYHIRECELTGIREKVIVRYYPYDPARIHLISPDGRDYLGAASEWGLVNPKDKEDVAYRIKIQQSIIKYWSELSKKYLEKARAKVEAVQKIGKIHREGTLAQDAKAADLIARKAKKARVSDDEIDDALIRAANLKRRG